MTTTVKPVRLSRIEDGYRYVGRKATYTIFHFLSGYGDWQWGCDLRFHDPDMIPGSDDSYIQTDTLADMRMAIAWQEVEA